MRDKILQWAFEIQRQTVKLVQRSQALGIPDHRHAALNPFAGEIVGHRLARLLGIGTTPSVRVVSLTEARQADPRKWIAKAVAAGGRLKADFGQRPPVGSVALLVEKIPAAIPLFYLREFYGVADALSPDGWSYGVDSRSAFDLAWWGNRIRFPERDANKERREAIAQVVFGKDAIPNAREFYSDFVPPEDWGPVRRAIAQNSDQMLAIRAMRLFLAASTAHHSNIFVDRRGHLFAIDFESCAHTNGEEIDIVFQNVAIGTRAFRALGRVAALTEQQLDDLFGKLPACPGWPTWPLGRRPRTTPTGSTAGMRASRTTGPKPLRAADAEATGKRI